MTNNDITSREPTISPEALALLGGGKIAYVKMVRSEDVQKQFPQVAATCAWYPALCSARGRRHPDPADRQPRSGHRQCLEPGA